MQEIHDRPSRIATRRHGIVVRLTHWINALCLAFLLLSGLQIFNAHPALYWGAQSDFDHPFLAMTATGDNADHGVTTIAGHAFDTTGVLGASRDADGTWTDRGFPRFLTWPATQDLATGRRWHFFFAWFFVANGVLYLLSGILSRHFARDLVPTRSDWRHIPAAILDHIRLHFPKGEEARYYNPLQKLSYLGVIFIALPLMVLTGLTMSPGIDSTFPVLLDAFGGRQSARTIHFITAWSLVLFVIVHVVMVIVSGLFNNIRSMITGTYVIKTREAPRAR